MRTTYLHRSAPFALVLTALSAVFVLTGCGQDDLTVAVADDVAGESMGIAEEPAEPAEAAPVPAALPDAIAAESAEAAPAPAIEEDVPTADEPGTDAPEAGETDPAVIPAAAGGDGGDGEAPAVAEDDPIDVALGDLPTTSEESAPPPVDEPAVPPTEAPANAAADGADETESGTEARTATDDETYPESWTPPPVEDPKLEDGVWIVTFDYLGSFDTGILALAEDSPMAIEARREQAALAEKPEPEPIAPSTDGDEIPVEPAVEIGFPDAVRKMDGQTVQIEGYMIPLKFDDGKVKSFFLSRYMMGCCFGVLPKANEIIEVEMVEGKGAFYDAYMPFVVTGKFVIVEDGTDPDFLRSVFRMTADSCDYSEDW